MQQFIKSINSFTIIYTCIYTDVVWRSRKKQDEEEEEEEEEQTL